VSPRKLVPKSQARLVACTANCGRLVWLEGALPASSDLTYVCSDCAHERLAEVTAEAFGLSTSAAGSEIAHKVPGADPPTSPPMRRGTGWEVREGERTVSRHRTEQGARSALETAQKAHRRSLGGWRITADRDLRVVQVGRP